MLRTKLRVLVPGAGLGRLAYDVANMGMSLYVLLAPLINESGTPRIYMSGKRVFALYAPRFLLYLEQVWLRLVP